MPVLPPAARRPARKLAVSGPAVAARGRQLPAAGSPGGPEPGPGSGARCQAPRSRPAGVRAAAALWHDTRASGALFHCQEAATLESATVADNGTSGCWPA